MIFPDFGDNLVCAGEPDEWLWSFVMGADVFPDRLLQRSNGPKGPSPQTLARDLCEPALDLISATKRWSAWSGFGNESV